MKLKLNIISIQNTYFKKKKKKLEKKNKKKIKKYFPLSLLFLNK